MKLTDYELLSLKKHMELSPNKHNIIKVCMYLRKSQEDVKENSLPMQRAAIEEAIKDLNTQYKGVFTFKYGENDIYAEDDRSGVFADNREKFQEMQCNIIRKKYGACFVFKYDRFSRNTADYNAYRDRMMANGCVLLPLDIRDEGNAASTFMINMMGCVALFHAQNSAELSMAGTRNRIAENKNVGYLPYGLTSNDEKYIVIEPNEAEVVRDIFNKAKEGYSLTDIADYLMDRNILTRKGVYFSHQTIERMLRNKKYIGTFIHGDSTKKVSENKRRHKVSRLHAEETIKPNAFEAIIDEELFNEVQSILDKNKRTTYTHNLESDYLLSGLVKCGDCGANMPGDSYFSGLYKTRVENYACQIHKRDSSKCCTKNVNAKYLNKVVKKIIVDCVNILVQYDSDEFNKLLPSLTAGIEKEVDRLKKLKVKYGNEIKNAIRIQLQYPDRADIYNYVIDENNNKIKELQEEIDELTFKIEQMKNDLKVDFSDIIITENMIFSNRATARVIVQFFIKEIIVTNEEIKIVMTYD